MTGAITLALSPAILALTTGAPLHECMRRDGLTRFRLQTHGRGVF